jgi:signal peptidase I
MPRRARWLFLAALGAVVAARPFRVEVRGSSMEPTLRDGDWLVATRAGRPRRGSVVVLAHPNRALDIVKRVAAIPGDEFDGSPLGPDQYVVVGDNSASSTDARDFGPVSRDAIQGVVRLRYHPRPGPVR